MVLWQRYFLKELFKVFSLIIGSFYFLYVLVDYSAHSKNLQTAHAIQIITYYLSQLIYRAEIFISVPLMLSVIKVLTTLNVKNEWIALGASGLSTKRLLQPFIYVGLLGAVLLALNFEFGEPKAMKYLSTFEDRYFSRSAKNWPVHHLNLTNDSVLIYQKFDHEKQVFFDAFWISDTDHLYRIKELNPFSEIPTGYQVDLLSRLPSGALEKQESYNQLTFEEMPLQKNTLFNVVHPPKWQSTTQLFKNLRGYIGLSKTSDREAKIASLFLYKISMPLVCLLVIMAPAPFCVRYNRHTPLFFIYAMSIFGLITFFTIVNTTLIISESQIIAPFWAILTPIAFFVSIFGYRYAKL